MASADDYARIMGDIQALFRSRLQIQILLALADGDKTLAQLRDRTGSSSQALIPKIRTLESQMLIEQMNYGYLLTPLGHVLTARITDFVMTIGSIRRHKDYWGTHDLTGIPQEFLFEIGKFLNAELIYDTTGDVIHVYNLYLKMVQEAAHIHGASSVMSPGLADALSSRIVEGIPVELVVNEEAAEGLRQEPYVTAIKQLLNFPNFKVLVSKVPFRIGLTVTDKRISLGLFKKDGKMYDVGTDLVSSEPDAIAWGENLFKHFKDQSVELVI
jgi:predicted transcriptional regulator